MLIPSLKLTFFSPLENGGKNPGSLEITIGNHPSLGAFAVSFRDGNSPTWITR